MFITKTIIMCTIICTVLGQISPEDVPFRRYCSSALSDAIRLICGSKYNSYSRQIQNTAYYTSTAHNRNPESLLLSKLVGDSYTLYRTHTGPIHECCRRPCGYAELKSYCAPD